MPASTAPSFDPLPDPTYQAEFYADTPVKRLLAWIIDTVVILAMSFVLAVATFGLAFFLFFGLFFLVGFAYRVVTLANGSATLGMRFMSIEFRKLNGQRFDLMDAFLHTLGFSILMSFIILQVISVVLMLTTLRKQGLTDHLFGTVALNRAA
ncbi:MAG: RDD family protein [Pseudomonadota bacterium]